MLTNKNSIQLSSKVSELMDETILAPNSTTVDNERQITI